MVIMQTVHQETGSHNVAASYICLDLSKVAEAPDGVSIFAGRQVRNHYIFVFPVKSIEAPDLSFLDRAGNSEPWINLVEGPAFLVLERRKKVCGGETIMIIADSGVKSENSGRAFTVLGRKPASFHADRAQCVSADAHQQLAAGRLGHIESIEQCQQLVGLRASQVGLCLLVEHYAGD